jgi:hypothetical protein
MCIEVFLLILVVIIILFFLNNCEPANTNKKRESMNNIDLVTPSNVPLSGAGTAQIYNPGIYNFNVGVNSAVSSTYSNDLITPPPLNITGSTMIGVNSTASSTYSNDSTTPLPFNGSYDSTTPLPFNISFDSTTPLRFNVSFDSTTPIPFNIESSTSLFATQSNPSTATAYSNNGTHHSISSTVNQSNKSSSSSSFINSIR